MHFLVLIIDHACGTSNRDGKQNMGHIQHHQIYTWCQLEEVLVNPQGQAMISFFKTPQLMFYIYNIWWVH